jgi:hypothetical protein
MNGFDYWAWFWPWLSAWAWPLISAVLGAFVTVIFVNRLQKPKLVATIAEDKYDDKSNAHYVHLKVRNISKPWLGGGTAVNCRGKIRLTDGRSFVTKWATRPNPIRTEIVPHEGTLKLVNIVEPAYVDQAKYEYLRPGDEKSLDVAVRFKGNPSCYIHTPENFQAQDYFKPEGKELGIGEYPFSVVFEFDGGKSDEFRFKIVNEAGDSAGFLSLKPST